MTHSNDSFTHDITQPYVLYGSYPALCYNGQPNKRIHMRLQRPTSLVHILKSQYQQDVESFLFTKKADKKSFFVLPQNRTYMRPQRPTSLVHIVKSQFAHKLTLYMHTYKNTAKKFPSNMHLKIPRAWNTFSKVSSPTSLR